MVRERQVVHDFGPDPSQEAIEARGGSYGGDDQGRPALGEPARGSPAERSNSFHDAPEPDDRRPSGVCVHRRGEGWRLDFILRLSDGDNHIGFT
jgi:hypothetical protein